MAAAVDREGSKRSVVAAGVMVVQRRKWIGMVLMMGAAMNHQSLTAGGSGRELRKGIGNGGVEGSGRTPDSIGISHLSGLQEVASPTAARRRRQAFARPVVGPPQYSPCFECPRLDSYVSIKTSSKLKVWLRVLPAQPRRDDDDRHLPGR